MRIGRRRSRDRGAIGWAVGGHVTRRSTVATTYGVGRVLYPNSPKARQFRSGLAALREGSF